MELIPSQSPRRTNKCQARRVAKEETGLQWFMESSNKDPTFAVTPLNPIMIRPLANAILAGPCFLDALLAPYQAVWAVTQLGISLFQALVVSASQTCMFWTIHYASNATTSWLTVPDATTAPTVLNVLKEACSLQVKFVKAVTSAV